MAEQALGKGGWIDLAGRVAVVTGAASGIGRACAIALAEAGAIVLALDLDLAGAEATSARIAQAGGQAHARRLDVTAEAEWNTVGDWVAADWNRIDILINSAGVVFTDRVGDAPAEIYRKTFAVNVEGSLLGMALALRFMRRAGQGAIVNLSSAAALRAATVMASYGASKAAIAHFTRSAALETARAGHDIRINAVLPGLVESAMLDTFCDIYEKLGPPETIVAAMTTGRAGTAEEIADLILFLSSDRARYISGAAIPIDRAQSA